MLKRIFRLKWKDINFLVRKRKYFHTKYFSFFYYDQYPNLRFNQISVNIPLKYSKKAVYRAMIKRKIVTYIQKSGFVNNRINWKFYKIFITLNKKNLADLKAKIEWLDKKTSNQYLLEEFIESFFRFSKKIWS